MPYQDLEQRIHQVRFRQSLLTLLIAICSLAVWTVGLGAASFVIDWQLNLPKQYRILMIVVPAVVLAVVAFKHIRRFLHRSSDDEIALQLERKHPELGARLISTVQFHRMRENPVFAQSRGMMDVVEEQTTQSTRTMSFGDILPVERMKKAALIAIGVGLVFGLSSYRFPDYLSAFFNRLLLSEVKYPTLTRIPEVLPGDLTVARGEKVEFIATASGRVPEMGRIVLVEPDSQQAHVYEVARGSEDRFSFTLDPVTRDWHYFFRIGDAVSPVQQLGVTDLPRVSEIIISMTFPEYTRQAPRTTELGDVRALTGTKLKFEVKTNKPVDEVMLSIEGGEDVPVTFNGGDHFTLEREVKTHERYFFKLADTHSIEGRRLTNPEPVLHTITPLEDGPPGISITRPEYQMEATPRSIIPLEFKVSDDFGVGKIVLRYAKVLDQEEINPKEIDWFDAEGKKTIDVTDRHWDLLPLKFAVGDVIRFVLIASDQKTPEPNLTESRSVEVRLLSPQAMLKKILLRQGEAIDRIERLMNLETENRAGVDKLLRGNEKEPEPEEANPPDK
jgi:hypothetical protein